MADTGCTGTGQANRNGLEGGGDVNGKTKPISLPWYGQTRLPYDPIAMSVLIPSA